MFGKETIMNDETILSESFPCVWKSILIQWKQQQNKEETIMKHRRIMAAFLVLCLTFLVLPTAVSAAEEVASGTCGSNLTWVLTDDGVLTISGEGGMADYKLLSTEAPWSSYVSQILAVTVEEGVTTIGEYAFAGCVNMTQVTLPESLGKIGGNAFYNCDGLQGIALPDRLKEIGPMAFSNMDGLTSITIPIDTEVIGEDAFMSCPNLKYIWVSEENINFRSDEIGVLFDFQMDELLACPQGYTGDYAVPLGVKTIARHAFSNCTQLTGIEIPLGVSEIGEDAFILCNGLTDIRFWGDAPDIAELAFTGVTASVTYPSGNPTWTADTMLQYGGELTWTAFEPAEVASGICGAEGDNLTWVLTDDGMLTISGTGEMDDYFSIYETAPWSRYRSRITAITVEPGVTTIGENAFYNCSGVKRITLSEGLRKIGTMAFLGCSAQEELVLPETLEEIAGAGFMSLGGVKSITIPAATIIIGEEAFSGCLVEAIWVAAENPNYSSDEKGVLFNKDKTELIVCPAGFQGGYVIPDGVKVLHNKSFNLCDLTSVEIPASVTTIEQYAFHFCDALATVRFLGDAPEIGSQAFTEVTAEVYYPAGNDTWNADTMLDYSGSLTWIPYSTGEVVTSGWSGATTWTLTSDGVMTVSGSGAMKNYPDMTAMPWYAYRDQIVAVYIEDGVTSIGNCAFYGMPALRSVVMADTVTNIGVFAFKNSTALTSAVLSAGLTQLGESAFYGCSSLRAIDIPASLWTVKPYTFKHCTALREVTFHEGNLTKISDGAFYNTGLTYVSLPECLDILDVYTFKNCANLRNIYLPSGLTEIRDAAFYGTAVKRLTIPEGVTAIGDYAFKKCVELETVSLPTTLQSIGMSAFMDCPALTAVTVPEGVTTIGGYAFKRCTAMSELTLPATLTEIGDSALHTCSALTALTIPENVATIGAYCFSTSALDEVTFEGDAPAIGACAFNKIAVTAYYPGDNATWTSDVMQNYGGAITWTAQ